MESHIASEQTHRKHLVHCLFYCCVTSSRMCILQALHNNGCMRHILWHLLCCCMWALPRNGWCLQSHATILTSSFSGERHSLQEIDAVFLWSMRLGNQKPFRLLHPEVRCMANRKLGYLDLQSRQLLRWTVRNLYCLYEAPFSFWLQLYMMQNPVPLSYVN
jgi:hypothetical protein